MRHARPIDVAKELSAHEERRPQWGHASERRSWIGRDRLADAIEWREPSQAFLRNGVAKKRRQLFRKKESALHQIGAFVRVHVLQRVRGLRTALRSLLPHLFPHPLERAGRSRHVAEDAKTANESRNRFESLVAAEKLVAAGSRQRHFPPKLRRRSS